MRHAVGFFAVSAQVGDRETLACLHLLAAADGRATGASAWNSWKATLVGSLVTKVNAVFDEQHPDEARDGAVATAQEVALGVLQEHPAVIDDPEPLVLVEANLGEGVVGAPLSKYQRYHTRICRPVGLTPEDRTRVCNFAAERIGFDYDVKTLPEYSELRDHIWRLVKDEALQTARGAE